MQYFGVFFFPFAPGFCGRKEELRNPGGDLHSWGTAELLGLEKRWDHIRILKYHVLATNSFALCVYQVLLEYTVTASTGCCMGITPHWNTWVSFVITAVLTASAQWVPEPNLLPGIAYIWGLRYRLTLLDDSRTLCHPGPINPEIPKNTWSYISTLLHDPNPTRYLVLHTSYLSRAPRAAAL